jgi:hypothetical protein
MNPNPTLDAMMISESEIFDGRKIKTQRAAKFGL